ncbi:lipopolysaccharide biosynthesis protein [Arthrobacter sp. RAF14]|uniref:lipopolysaccharide biosynthesis protein n=1 Tax=Arthrobacter sp. RAF14 TaxID=3233051 RepID=UPI003F9302EF
MLGTISQGLVRFLYSVLIGRFLGPVVLANVNSGISLALLLSLLWPTSSGQAATRYVAEFRGAGKPEQARAVATYLGRRVLVSGVLLALITVFVSYFILNLGLWTSFGSGALLLGFAGWSYARGVQYGAGLIVRASLWDTAGSVLAIVLLLGVLFFHAEPLLLLPLSIGYGAYAVICWPRRSGRPLDKELRGTVNKFVSYGVLGTLSSTGMLQLAMIWANFVGTKVDTGHFAAALSLATPATMVARTFSQVLFPSMAEATGRNDSASLRRQTDIATKGMFIVMTGVFGTLALASPLVMLVLYGPSFSEADTLLAILLVAVLFTTLPIAAVNRLNSMGLNGARGVSLTAAGGLLLALLLWAVLGPPLGVLGIAIGYLCVVTTTSAVPIIWAWRLDDQRWLGMVIRVLLGLAVAIGAFILCRGLGASPLVHAGAAVAFAIIWFAVNWHDIKHLKSFTGRPAKS